MGAKTYTDKHGYKRGKIEHSDLIHRQKAYRSIYLKNRDKYPLSFRKYVVHHKDKNKKNNNISNLEIMLPEDHEKLHGITKTKPLTNYYTTPTIEDIEEKPVKEITKNKPKKDYFVAIMFILVIISLFIIYTHNPSTISAEQDLISQKLEGAEDSPNIYHCSYPCAYKCQENGKNVHDTYAKYNADKSSCDCKCNNGKEYYDIKIK